MRRWWLWMAPAIVLISSPAFGDDDDEEEEEHEHHEQRGSRSSASGPSGVAPVTNPAWSEECGSCHFAYPPGLLPARSWGVLLKDLGNHFGDDASVSDAKRAELVDYATKNAADATNYRLSASIARATAGETPLRISEIPGLAHEHREMPRSWWKDNPEVKSLSNCAACHTRAAEGSFRESEIRVPGHGSWED
jgi:hypothetical protein